MALLNLPRCEFDASQEHRLHCWDISEEQLHMLMNPKLVGDNCTEANPKHLAYANKVLFYILCNSLTPVNRPESIRGIRANALHAIAHGVRFDVPDLFIRNLAFAADSPQALKPYAPWVMFAIEQLLKKKYFCQFVPNVFMPPVRNTLQIVKDIGK